jgi:aminopeptidase
MVPDECAEIKLEEASEEQLRFEDPIDLHLVERIHASIGIWGQDNTKSLTGTDPKRQAIASQARKKYLSRFLERAAKGELRWVGTQFPCHSAAQDAQMSLAAYERFVFQAGLLHLEDPASAWGEISRRQQRVADHLNRTREIRFVTPQGTDLTLGVDGRRWINCDGHENFPDGEVFTGPIEDATEGVVCYSFPAVYGGREVDGIRLSFKSGRVVDASAAKGEEFLIAMLDQDPGARVLGEIALGTNYAIQEYTKNTLFDEKIGGTFHAALGAAYPETGGKNDSGLHWDMVCDLRQGGRVFADGELIAENGRFRNPDWPQPK